jgi:uncharacterized membrane protein
MRCRNTWCSLEVATMNALVIVRLIAIVCTGLVAGIFLGHRMGVSMATPHLPPSSYVQLQQIIHVHFVRMMPALVLASVGGSVLWTILLRSRWSTAGFWLVLGASVAMVAVLVMTRAVNIPINNQLMTWSIQAPPTNLMELWRPWEQVHSIRTVLAIAAFAAQVVALSTFASSSHGLR